MPHSPSNRPEINRDRPGRLDYAAIVLLYVLSGVSALNIIDTSGIRGKFKDIFRHGVATGPAEPLMPPNSRLTEQKKAEIIADAMALGMKELLNMTVSAITSSSDTDSDKPGLPESGR